MGDIGAVCTWMMLTLFGGIFMEVVARRKMMPRVARYLAPGQWKTATVVQKRRIVSSLTDIVHHVCMVAIALPILWDRYPLWSAERFACTDVLRYDSYHHHGPNILYTLHLSYCFIMFLFHGYASKNESEAEESVGRDFSVEEYRLHNRVKELPDCEAILVAMHVRQPGHLRTLLRYGLSIGLMHYSLLHQCMMPAGVLIIGMCEASEIFHKLWFIGRWMKSETLTSVAFLCFSVIFFCARFVVLPAEFARFSMNPNNHLTTSGYVIGLLLMVLVVCNVLDLFYGVNPFVLMRKPQAAPRAVVASQAAPQKVRLPRTSTRIEVADPSPLPPRRRTKPEVEVENSVPMPSDAGNTAVAAVATAKTDARGALSMTSSDDSELVIEPLALSVAALPSRRRRRPEAHVENGVAVSIEAGNPAVAVIAAANGGEPSVPSPDDADLVREVLTEAAALYEAAQASGIDLTMEKLLPRFLEARLRREQAVALRKLEADHEIRRDAREQAVALRKLEADHEIRRDAVQQLRKRRRETDAKLRLLQDTKEKKVMQARTERSLLRSIVEITIVSVAAAAIMVFWKESQSAMSDGA